jgi:hypothetical protein
MSWRRETLGPGWGLTIADLGSQKTAAPHGVAFHGMAALDDIRLKVSRATQHLDALSKEIREVFTEHQSYLTGQHNPVDDSYTAILHEVPPVSREWGLVLGECVHHARGALDHLVAALVIADGGAVGNRHQFPICRHPKEWQSQVMPRRGNGKLDFIKPAHVAFIESIQPYQTGIGFPSLNTLQRFSNADKHRLIHGAIMRTVARPALTGQLAIPLRITEVIYADPNTPVDEGIAVARYKAPAEVSPIIGMPVPGSQVHIHAKIRLTTVFGEPGHEDTRIADFRTVLSNVSAIVDNFTGVLTL